MKKLLVMGSNFGAVGIVKRAKERGIFTIVTDYYDVSRSNAKLYCDECWNISTTETEKLAQKCREEHVDAVTCGVSEFTSEMTFKLCDALGLPKYCSWESWSYARNKRKFKDLCKKNGVPVAQDYLITDPEDTTQTDCVQYPVVVKPIDCGGNSGVSFCNNLNELKTAFQKAREVSDHKETIICERKLEGREYAAAYALAEGEASLIDFFAMNSEEGAPTNCYSLDVTRTGLLHNYLDQIDEGIKKVFKDAGFREGFVWIEVMTDQNNNMYVLETGYRFPGGMIAYSFAEACGFNAIDWYLDCFLGIKHRKEDLPKPQKEEYSRYGISYLIWNREGGIIKDVLGLEEIAERYPSVLIDFIRKPGYELHPFSLMGEILFTTDNREQTIELLSYVNDHLQVINEEGNNVVIYYTGFDKIY